MPSYTPPKEDEQSFHCPHCEVFSHQRWTNLRTIVANSGGRRHILNGRLAECMHCRDFSIWVDGEMVYPSGSPAPLPSDDMPEHVKEDFNEAREIVEKSPRASSALLRLAIEKLVIQLTGEENKRLNVMIGILVEDGRIDRRVQQALDSVRVVGNESVHPGEVDRKDDRETALRLFSLVNTIVELTITRERLISEEYGGLSENQMKGIENRDGKS